MTSIAKKFQKLNFHDSTIEDIRIIPSSSYGVQKAKIIVSFQDEDGNNNELEFADCRNIQLSVDFDLLKDNSGFGNTSRSESITKPQKLIKLIRQIDQASNIEYYGIKSPVEKKIEKIERLKGFYIYFFGGTLKIIAEKFSVEKHKSNR